VKPTAKQPEPGFWDEDAAYFCVDCLDEFDTFEEWQNHRENVAH
jgi:hypothetical protein